MVTRWLVGTSGFVFGDWRDKFYPAKLPRARWLEFYAAHYATVELNNSFYRLPSEANFTKWRDSSPVGFVFALKVSRLITHIRRLKNSEDAVETFISRAIILGEKLGPLLYQLPPNMHRNDDVLASFLSGLPGEIKHVIEFRHQSWLEKDVFDILRSHNIGLCVFDMPSLTCPLVATADFAYVRFHGRDQLYASNYSDEQLAEWAGRLRDLATNLKEVYVYFNNDIEAFAVNNAITLRDYLTDGGGLASGLLDKPG